ncbi:major facilitator superfamily domain-containing protein [Globomyces pollinis-pini]|nr:major facilitator superfamily domain-containing protein [Globomyces pollinis-pini]
MSNQAIVLQVAHQDEPNHSNIENNIKQNLDVEPTDFLESKDTMVFPEGGYGWVVVLASFVIQAICLGIPSVFGVFNTAYLQPGSFEGTHSTFAIAFIGSTTLSCLGLFGIPSGRLVDVMGHRLMCVIGGCIMMSGLVLASYSTNYWQIYLCHGLLFGIGAAIAYYAALTIITHYFNKKKGLATGIAVAGAGIGGMFLAPLFRYLITTIGLKSTLRFAGIGSGAVVVSMAFLLVPRLPTSHGQPMDYAAVAKDPKFVRLFMIAVFGSLGYFIPFFFIPTFASRHGMSATDGALIVGLLNGASAFGRIALGFNADLLGHVNSLCLCISVASLATLLLWPFSTTFAILTTFGIIYGFFIGGFVSLLPTAIVQLFGVKNIGTIIGMVYSGIFVGYICGPPMAGLLLDSVTSTDAFGVQHTNFLPSILLGGGFLSMASLTSISLKLVINQ